MSELNEIRLHQQNLFKFVLDVLLTASVPIVAQVDMLELQRRHPHDERLDCTTLMENDPHMA